LKEPWNEIRKNLSTQYDEAVGSIFLKSDIITLWQSLQRQNYDFLEKENSLDIQPIGSDVVNE